MQVKFICLHPYAQESARCETFERIISACACQPRSSQWLCSEQVYYGTGERDLPS